MTKTTMRLPKALLQNQAAVMTDFIDGGAWVNANCRPGIDSSTSPIMIKKNCGNCHKIENHFNPFWSIITWRMPEQTNDNEAQMPPNITLVSGSISTFHNRIIGTIAFCQTGIIISNIDAPIAFAWSASNSKPNTVVLSCDAWNVQLESIWANNAQ